MSNILVDGFPKDYRGYRINTDFRVGIRISLIMDDTEFSEDVRIETCIRLLFIDIPDESTAYRGLIWFLSGGKSETAVVDDDNELDVIDRCNDVNDNTILFDFNYDANQIWGGFWSKGVDLETANMHWFKFLIALQNLYKPVISTLFENRTIDLKDMKGKQKLEYAKIKNRARVRRVVFGDEAIDVLKNRSSSIEEELNHMSKKERELWELNHKVN